jgi:hypothetical protein
VQTRHLDVPFWSSFLFEVEPDLAHCHHARIVCNAAKEVDVRRRFLGRVVADPRPNLAVTSRERDGHAAARCVHSHRHHPRHARIHRRADNG